MRRWQVATDTLIKGGILRASALAVPSGAYPSIFLLRFSASFYFIFAEAKGLPQWLKPEPKRNVLAARMNPCPSLTRNGFSPRAVQAVPSKTNNTTFCVVFKTLGI
jgi:hypothetical protein